MEDNVILSLDMAMIINNAYKNDIDKILEADTIVTKFWFSSDNASLIAVVIADSLIVFNLL